MQVEWLQFVVGKAQKIFYYEMFPRTDEQYSIRRIGLIKSLNRAYKKYRENSDYKYKTQIKKIKRALVANISKTEYLHCKKIIEEYKAGYSRIIDKELWNYKALSSINYKLLCNELKSVEEAAEEYERELNEPSYP